jgi:DNA-binding CsgD family transcriptional regulator/PAS domain-containing protein
VTLDPENVVASIYEAASEPEMWASVLQNLSHLVGGAAMYLCHVPVAAPSTGYTWSHDFDPDCVATYKRDYAPHEPDLRAGIALPVGILQDSRAVYGADSFSRDPGHRALFGAQGLSAGLLAPPHRDTLTMSMFLCMRGKRRGRLQRDAVGSLQGLMPHMRRALGLQQRIARLENDARLVADALGSLSQGVLIVGADMHLLFANGEAERILALGDGMTQRSGRLIVTDKRAQAALMREVAKRAAGTAGGGRLNVAIPRPSGAPALSAFVAPRGTRALAGGCLPARAVATIFVADPIGPGGVPSADALRRQFGLTCAEAEVARLVALGLGLPHAARQLGVSINTVRTHLRAVFEKLGVNQQAALVRVIARSFPTGIM